VLAVERPEHGFEAEPELESEGQMVQCQMRGCSKVGIMEMVMRRVKWCRSTFLLLKQVEMWWQG
jgi:hypothetical protein